MPAIESFEIELKRFEKDEGYSFSSEENGKKRIYTIYSAELKEKARKIFFPYGIDGSGNIQYRGENREGDRIIYKQGSSIDLPDKLILISRELAEQEFDEQDKIFAEMEKEIAELEQRKKEWDKQNQSNLPSGSERHFFISKNNEGKVEVEGSLKVENKDLDFHNKQDKSFYKNSNFYLITGLLALVGSVGVLGFRFYFL